MLYATAEGYEAVWEGLVGRRWMGVCFFEWSGGCDGFWEAGKQGFEKKDGGAYLVVRVYLGI